LLELLFGYFFPTKTLKKTQDNGLKANKTGKIPVTPYFCKCKMENDFQLKIKS